MRPSDHEQLASYMQGEVDGTVGWRVTGVFRPACAASISIPKYSKASKVNNVHLDEKEENSALPL